MSKYYYHATSDLSLFRDILKDQAIKSPRLLGKTIEHDLGYLSFNGLDYISLCNKLDHYDDNYGDSSFEQFILDSFCFIISGEINVVKPTIIDWANFYEYIAIKEEIYKNIDLGLHVSFYADEYRVKDKVTIDKILGIGIPVNNHYLKEDLMILKQVLIIANELNLDVVDSSDRAFVEKYETSKYNKEEVVKKLKGLGL